MAHPLSSLTSGAISSPFTQLRKLLAGVPPGHERPIELTIGEPREAMPDFIQEKLNQATALYGKYPPIRGAEDARNAIAEWLTRRYSLPRASVDAEREVLMLSGSREGLFFACLPAVGRKEVQGQPAILMCNPYYSAYVAGAIAVGAEPVYLNATRATGFLPDLDEIAQDQALLARTVALFINSPSNPQGTVADRNYILRALELARAHDFMLFLDECYSEIYTEAAPIGGLEVAAATPDRFRNLIVFNSLSKRSNLPGLRSGFCAGDASFIEAYGEVRNMCAPTVPLPVQHASAAIWRDEGHVERSREAYREKFLIADRVLGDRYGYIRPAGGFCLWLDMSQFGGGAQAAVTLWQRAGVKVIPGSFLAQTGRDGTNPGADYVRVAMVQDAQTIQEALERTSSVLR
ncbi:aminotransferase class I/II-fold pyridoxal phosphate-dependent enzyme [Hyphomicrobium sp.]|uniref:aminotransferase class I/II-fold pyridoxal phosphate-dependent enzyme n=1 Tax=Hyphomicrobium sp. TaxID=82 RepID=UPI0025BC8748|nr:aminotransferase class I/II-fold pyridoxal phosphate-dependent enzyme [Hyphomicrobium sp.]